MRRKNAFNPGEEPVIMKRDLLKDKIGQRTPYQVHFTPRSSKSQVQSNKKWGLQGAKLDNRSKIMR